MDRQRDITTTTSIGLAPIVAVKNEGTNTFKYFIWTPAGRLLYMIDGGDGNKVYHYHFDMAGSTLALTNASGQVTDSYAYDPYGKVVGRNGTTDQPFTFVGAWGVRQEGSNGIYHMRARYYDAKTARFLSREPIWPQIDNPKALNPYQYAANNPLSFVDITGLSPEFVPGYSLEEIDSLLSNLEKHSEDVGHFMNNVVYYFGRENSGKVMQRYLDIARAKNTNNAIPSKRETVRKVAPPNYTPVGSQSFAMNATGQSAMNPTGQSAMNATGENRKSSSHYQVLKTINTVKTAVTTTNSTLVGKGLLNALTGGRAARLAYKAINTAQRAADISKVRTALNTLRVFSTASKTNPVTATAGAVVDVALIADGVYHLADPARNSRRVGENSRLPWYDPSRWGHEIGSFIGDKLFH